MRARRSRYARFFNAGRCRLTPFIALAVAGLLGLLTQPAARGHEPPATGEVHFDPGVDPQVFLADLEIETQWRPAYLERLRPEAARRAALARGRSPRLQGPTLQDASTAALAPHGAYAWFFPPGTAFTLGHAIQSYQNYGGTPYFHHGIDVMAPNGTDVFHRAGGQVVNVENYQPGNDLYWEVAFLDPYGYLWQYHHIDKNTIPQSIKDKFAEYQANPATGGFVTGDVYIGDVVYWTVVSFGKRFNHIHLNIFDPDGRYVNGLEFFDPLNDTAAPQVLSVGLLQGGAVYAGTEVSGTYGLYAQVRDLVLDDVYWLPPYEVTFSVDGGPTESVWRFQTLPGGGDDKLYLNDYYVVPPTCGNYSCRDFYINLGFIPGSSRTFPTTGGQHEVVVTAYDFAGNATSQAFTWDVLAPPAGTPVWSDDFETDRGWVRNPSGTDTATSGLWERGDPAGTTSSGAKQLNDTVSGVNALVTGRLAGSSASSYDVDGGVTSIRSPAITLPASGDLTLSFYFYFAHTSGSSQDYFRVKVVGTTTQTLFEELGAADDDDAVWSIRNLSLNDFRGQTVRLLFEAADGGTATSVVEAAVDDVLIVVNNPNTPPVADDQSLSTPEDTSVEITLTGTDADGDPLTASVATAPAHGTLSYDPFTYTPAANYHGPDSFTFIVNDGQEDSDPATVSITVTPVNDAPVADAQALTTPQDTPLALLLSGSDVDGDLLGFGVLSGPAQGTLSGTPPSLTYTPATGYHGPDSFLFVVTDGQGGQASATVSLTVLRVNHAPVATAQSLTTAEDTLLPVSLTATDADGDQLTFSVATQPVHGLLSGSPPDLTYQPASDYHGSDAFTFTASDGQDTSAPATISITVTPVNDPPVAYPASVSLAEDTSRAINLGGMDVDGDPLTYLVKSDPAQGTLSGTAPNLTYTPAPNFFGPDAFTFAVSDGTVESVPATISLTVTPVNDAPEALPQTVSTSEDTPTAIVLTGFDLEGSPLTFEVLTAPAQGTLSGTPPTLTYTPAANAYGGDSFTFRVNDGALNSAAATVSITVTPVNDAPVATPQSVTLAQDSSVTITLAGVDVDGDALSFALVDGPANGTLSGTPPSLSYTPAVGFTGSDSFTFTVSDGALTSSPATVTLTVNPSGPVTVFEDDFETNQGWVRNPNGDDTATLGLWERADPQATSSSGAKQLGTTASGSYDLVTGPLAGRSAGDYDVDGGKTSIRSPAFALPAGRTIQLSFKYYLAHASNSSNADYLRVRIVGATTTTVFQELGAANDDDAVWATFTGAINSYAGQTVYLLIEAADANGASLVEAAIDDVRVVAQ